MYGIYLKLYFTVHHKYAETIYYVTIIFNLHVADCGKTNQFEIHREVEVRKKNESQHLILVKSEFDRLIKGKDFVFNPHQGIITNLVPRYEGIMIM